MNNYHDHEPPLTALVAVALFASRVKNNNGTAPAPPLDPRGRTPSKPPSRPCFVSNRWCWLVMDGARPREFCLVCPWLVGGCGCMPGGFLSAEFCIGDMQLQNTANVCIEYFAEVFPKQMKHVREKLLTLRTWKQLAASGFVWFLSNPWQTKMATNHNPNSSTAQPIEPLASACNHWLPKLAASPATAWNSVGN